MQQEYIQPTLLAVLAVALDLVVNRQFSKKDLIPCMVTIPRELLLLSMGFVFTYTGTANCDEQITTGTTMIIISFVLSLVIYALCRFSTNAYSSLANKSENQQLRNYFPLLGSITLSILFSVLFFYVSIIICFGGK